MRALVLAALIATSAAAQPRVAGAPVTEEAARAFVAKQEQAWNARKLDAWFAAFTPDATFTDQAYNGGKPPVPYGTSTLKEARALIGKAAPSRETGRVFRIVVAPDGRSAEVTTSVGIRSGERRLCASRVQTLVLAGRALKSKGQTDTYIRCRGG
ncbi:hypothetical protein [Phenylobacterium sp.]|uniref:hypothetical protein n=1 Tax=Phenylobacterium sp. TaxID=1871053 RepID=UPI0025F41E7F|nr:hypothetical protein [Phenylobacterium sp.]MBX3485007.1 hypothetical protein [Phenylobacterium sp.]MCW5759797.1 hypothetical protein [Phenylobacterium sp.]